jgi:hypothetical protein
MAEPIRGDVPRTSWEEHLRQHEGRLTATDQAIEDAALAFSDPRRRRSPASSVAKTATADCGTNARNDAKANQAQRRDALQLNNMSAEPALITWSSVTPHSAARSQPMYCHSS